MIYLRNKAGLFQISSLRPIKTNDGWAISAERAGFGSILVRTGTQADMEELIDSIASHLEDGNTVVIRGL